MLEIYLDMICEHRWRLRATNGRIVAEGGEGYARRSDLLETVSKLSDAFANAVIVDIHPAPKSTLEQDDGTDPS